MLQLEVIYANFEGRFRLLNSVLTLFGRLGTVALNWVPRFAAYENIMGGNLRDRTRSGGYCVSEMLVRWQRYRLDRVGHERVGALKLPWT
jgi:hypothetical protein